MRFADIIGQDDIKRHLIGTVKENRISHAQMLLGREGYGTLPLAIAYAQYINCQHRTDSDSCGECPSCRQISQLAYPDLHFVFPVPATGSTKEKPVSDTFFRKWSEFIKQNPYGSYQQWLDYAEAGNSQGLIRVDESSEIIRKLTMKSFN
ncbi:MAG: DNA polymerase III subunit delta, partial [Salinivirgaceae bacterium]|nr:DNA polymerase III subunit delta [Salinivirgaceae bacterium]